MTHEPVRTVRGVLARLDTTFPSFVEAFEDGQYVLWLGSGISRDRVPNVHALLERVIEFLRVNVDQGSETCPYKYALDRVLQLALLTRDEKAKVNVAEAFHQWELRDRILNVLADQYSKVLDIRVDGKDADFLVWDVLDIRDTYGAPAIAPDVEHLCIAILMLEGLIDSAVTANWDGLVEAALRELTPSPDAVARIIVRPDDFHLPRRRVDFIKFHGCAVRARDDASYRPLLIARMSQISVWAARQEHRLMRKRLESLYTERPTLMLGLSAQDANLHLIFGTAVEDLARPWSAAGPPAIVFSEEAILQHHEHVLQITYGADYDEHGSAISAAAVLGSFGKVTLIALVLTSLARKLTYLLERVLEPLWSEDELRRLANDLGALRNTVAQSADPDDSDRLDHSEVVQFQRDFLKQLIDVTRQSLSVFRTGRAPSSGGPRYEPLSDRPVTQAIHGPDFPAAQFGLLGLALALIARGHSTGDWSAVVGDGSVPTDAPLYVAASGRITPVLFLKDATALTALELEADFDDLDAAPFVVVADVIPPASPRSPKSRYGRDGRARATQFSMASIVSQTASSDEAYEAFRLAGGF